MARVTFNEVRRIAQDHGYAFWKIGASAFLTSRTGYELTYNHPPNLEVNGCTSFRSDSLQLSTLVEVVEAIKECRLGKGQAIPVIPCSN